MATSLTEESLVARARGGDARAYEELVRQHQHVAFRVATVLARSAPDAEEAVQDAFVKAWRALDRFRSGSPFRPWLLAIVANEARSRRRAADRRRGWTERAAREPAWIAAGSSASAETAALAVERRETLLVALRGLPEHHRTPLELRFLLDLSEQEMAAAMGCRRGTVKSRLSRALDRLRDELEAQP